MIVAEYARRVIGKVRVAVTAGERRVELALGEHLFTVPYTKNALPQQPFDGTTLEQLMADGPAAIQGRVVHLIEVEVVDRAAQHLDWEKWLRAGMTRPIAVVRKSVVRPRALDVPLTYPLRWLTLRSQGPDRYGPPLKSEFDLVFSVADAREAVIVDDAEEDEVIAFRRTVAWPTAEVIHFDHPPLMNVEALFDLTASWQTRLVVFETPTPTELAETAGRLADLGGPAVLIVKPGLRFPLCLSLVHDEPLDWLAFQLASEDLILVGGAGREDLLRVSRIARMLESTELDRTIQEQLQTAPNDAELELGFAGGTPADTSFLSSFRSVEARTLSELSFDQERRGTLPSAHLVRKLQAAVRSARPPTPPLRAPTEANERRHVNAVLHHVSERERSLLDSAYGWVEPLQELELAVQIGARIEGLRTIGSAAFLEEAVLWDADAQQTILEVGVTSLDFELFGAPVQRIALPRTGDSAIATFRLKAKAETRIPGVARLRFCLYHGNTLIQSFRVAVAHGKQPPDGEELPNAFQRALDLSHEHAALLRGVAGGYFARLEYSAFDLEHIRDFKPRRVSFFVNDSEGEVVVTTKGDEIFSGEISPNLTGYVSEARNTLKNSSYALDAEGGLIPNVYRFFNEKKLNVGDEVAYDAALCDLAAAGFDLYSALVPRDDQPKFERALSEPRQIVHAGHLKLDGVVPWNLLYLRRFDDKSGKPTKACSAPVEGSHCGDHPDCPLHTSNAARGFTDTTTACPRYFLGFRQLVEVPPQQVQGIKQTLAEQSDAASSMNRVIACGPKVRTLVGYNPALRLAKDHAQALQAALSKALVLPPPITLRNELLAALGKPGDPAVVYVFCHALDSFQGPRRRLGAHLVIENSADLTGRIVPADIGSVSFARSPLVFLNGCHTVGFSPFAPAEFIQRFTEAGASAVIGTEATVWEGLATEMALEFMKAFIDGEKTAGEALLEARLALLRKKNPLGLAYTLYGPADLRLELK